MERTETRTSIFYAGRVYQKVDSVYIETVFYETCGRCNTSYGDVLPPHVENRKHRVVHCSHGDFCPACAVKLPTDFVRFFICPTCHTELKDGINLCAGWSPNPPYVLANNEMVFKKVSSLSLLPEIYDPGDL